MGFRHTEKGRRVVLASMRKTQTALPIRQGRVMTPRPSRLFYSAGDPASGRILASVKGRYYVGAGMTIASSFVSMCSILGRNLWRKSELTCLPEAGSCAILCAVVLALI